MSEKTLISWSSGMLSALSLHHIQTGTSHQAVKLFTNVSQDQYRLHANFHGISTVLLEKQALAIGMPLQTYDQSEARSLDEFKARMVKVLQPYPQEGITTMAFGDIQADPVKQHRLEYLSKVNMKGLFPLWEFTYMELVKRFTDLGFKAVIVSVDPRILDGSLLLKILDFDFFKNHLPNYVKHERISSDFHTFVFDGPIFKKPVAFKPGNIYMSNTFLFQELLP